MKKIFLIMLVLSSLGICQQSLFSPYPNLIFRDVMNNATNSYDAGAKTITSVVYSQSKAVFNGVSSNITYNNVSGVKSVRIKLTLATTTQNILKLTSTHSISVSGGTISATGFSSPSIYVNGVLSSTITTAESEIVVTTATAITANLFTLGYVSGYLNGNVNYIECYKSALNPSEIYNLAFDLAFKDLVANQSEVLGSELVTNGGFNSSSGWALDQASISNNSLIITANGTNAPVAGRSDIVFSNEKLYKITYTISNNTLVGSGLLNIGSYSGGEPVNAMPITDLTIGTHSQNFTAIRNSTLIFFRIMSGFTSGSLTFTNISIKEVLSASTPLLIDFTSISGVIKDMTGKSITNTSTTIKRAGSVWSADFNGSTSKLDYGNIDALTGDITIAGWVNARGLGEASVGTIIENDKFLVWHYIFSGTSIVYAISSNYSTIATGALKSSQLNKWIFVSITRTNSGIANFYIGDSKNPPTISGTANQSSGTPIAGTTNIIVGNNNASNRTWNGLIPQMRLYKSILTQAQINQLWSSQAGRFQ